MPDKFDKAVRSRIMSNIRAKDTMAEKILRKALWHNGLRGYRTNCNLLGKPDIAFIKKRLVIFVDGDFWHGYAWKVLGKIPPKGYWQSKITKNIERDIRVNKQYKKEGWSVLRFWEHDVNKNSEKCAKRVAKTIHSKN